MQIKKILNDETLIGTEITVCGWITTERDQKKLLFVALNDGSCFKSLQIVVELTEELKTEYAELLARLTRGVSLRVTGNLIESPAKGQKVEMSTTLDKFEVLGDVDVETYPMSKMKHPPEYLRQFPHLRVRTNTGGMVARIRNTCSKATHDFFQERGFMYVHTPILTSNDCEGAGETFGAVPTGVKDSKEFFGEDVNMTVSGQLHVETYAIGLTNVYTFGPTFRAERSNTSRHLAEFWMIEPEMCFIDFGDLMNTAEAQIKYCVQAVLDNNVDDVEFINRMVSKGRRDMLEKLCKEPFKRLSYTEAIDVLIADYKDGCGYDEVKEWGIDMNSEQEKYLVRKFGPVIVYNYPQKIKSFYMKVNEDTDKGITVQAMDILVPDVGELIGGSMRENDPDRLESIMKEKDIDQDLDWYLDLRRYGGAEHGGWGLGFERLIMLITGMKNVKDCIPYPRFFGKCQY